MYSLIFIGIAAFILSLLATPVVRDLSRSRGLLDRPDHVRKLHTSPVPRLGGVPVALAYVLSYAILLALPLQGGHIVTRGLPLTWRLLPAAILIFGAGLIDDLIGLAPWQKLIAQCVAAGGAFWAGVQLTDIAGLHLQPWLSLLVTILWLLACTNALNLIDGIDGLAVGVGLFASITTLAASLVFQTNVPLALATAPLVGALLGFLRYNFNPATIFLGDSGSLFIGFLLGCYGILWAQKSATILGIAAPLMALSVPLLDTSVAIVRRFLRHQPIFAGDRGHIHHQLLRRGLTPRRVSLVLYGCCCLGAVCSLGVMNPRYAAIAIAIFCAGLWFGIQRLGYVEFGVVGRMCHDGSFRRHVGSQIALHGLEETLRAAESPESCWTVIRDASRDFGFHHIEMRLSGRLFRHRNGLSADRAWSIRIPLSDDDYLDLTRAFDEAAQAPAVAPFADLIRRVLTPKLPAFAAAASPRRTTPPLNPHPATQGD